jgi:hypothetical protein
MGYHRRLECICLGSHAERLHRGRHAAITCMRIDTLSVRQSRSSIALVAADDRFRADAGRDALDAPVTRPRSPLKRTVVPSRLPATPTATILPVEQEELNEHVEHIRIRMGRIAQKRGEDLAQDGCG